MGVALATALLVAIILSRPEAGRSYVSPPAASTALQRRGALAGLLLPVTTGLATQSALADAPTNAEYGAVAATKVFDMSGAERKVGDLIPTGRKSVLAMLTHFGDFNSWEYAQQLKFELPKLQKAGVALTVVGIGTVAAAKKFSQLLDLPQSFELYADPTGATAKALECSGGFGAGLPVNGYLKLLPMLVGIGSPGTLGAVFRGYRGDPTARRDWVDASIDQGTQQGRFPSGYGEKDWDSIGKDGIRPMELATLRLQNMVDGIIKNWDELAPTDDQLFVQQGGTVIFDDQKPTYVYKDRGILTYTPIDEVLSTLGCA